MTSTEPTAAPRPAAWRGRIRLLALGLLGGCRDPSAAPAPTAPATTAPPSSSVASGATATASRALEAEKVEVVERAMGTDVTLASYTTDKLGGAAIRAAMQRAVDEIRRVEGLMSEWRSETEIGQVNARAGSSVVVSQETLDVVTKGLWAGRLSSGAFDVTFDVMSQVWKFGDAAEPTPKLPDPKLVEELRERIDYRKVGVDTVTSTIRIERGMRIGLGGIAKGYGVDRAAAVLRAAGVSSFLVQAGGDLYGAGRKAGGAPWVSGVQDPRGPRGKFFAVIELVDHAFSTAGDYARSFVIGGRRYHHIIDPRTGWPATACRSVTVWAPDALTADAADDAVFVLGPEKGLAIVESLDGVGALVVDQDNKVWTSKRLEGKVKILAEPTGGI